MNHAKCLLIPCKQPETMAQEKTAISFKGKSRSRISPIMRLRGMMNACTCCGANSERSSGSTKAVGRNQFRQVDFGIKRHGIVRFIQQLVINIDQPAANGEPFTGKGNDSSDFAGVAEFVPCFVNHRIAAGKSEDIFADSVRKHAISGDEITKPAFGNEKRAEDNIKTSAAARAQPQTAAQIFNKRYLTAVDLLKRRAGISIYSRRGQGPNSAARLAENVFNGDCVYIFRTAVM